MKNFNKIANCPITFHVNEEEKTVTAVMHDASDIFINYLLSNQLDQCKEGVVITPFLISTKRCPYIRMRKDYSAHVHCDPADHFDSEIGRKLAKKKLMQNVYRAFSRRLSRYILHLDQHKSTLIRDLKAFDAANN